MSSEDPHVIFSSGNQKSVDLISDFLTSHEINYEIIHHMPESDGLGLTAFASSDASNELRIVVNNQEQKELAQQLISSHAEEILNASKLVGITPAEIAVECESCGKTSVFPGDLQGTVQDCAHCGGYVDVPGGEDDFDWSIVDETVAEDDIPTEDDDESDAWG